MGTSPRTKYRQVHTRGEWSTCVSVSLCVCVCVSVSLCARVRTDVQCMSALSFLSKGRNNSLGLQG